MQTFYPPLLRRKSGSFGGSPVFEQRHSQQLPRDQRGTSNASEQPCVCHVGAPPPPTAGEREESTWQRASTGSRASKGNDGRVSVSPAAASAANPKKGELLESTWQERLAGMGRDELRSLLDLVEQRQTQFSELNLATALHRVAALGGGRERATCSRLIARIEDVLKARPEAFRAQSLANMSWAVARLQWPSEGLLDLLGTAARPQLTKFKSPEVSMLLWGLASAPSSSAAERTAMMDAVACEVARRGAAAFDAQSLATVAYAAGTLGHPCDSPLWATLAAGAEDRVSEFSDRQVVNLVWAYATVTSEDGTSLFNRVEDAWLEHIRDLASIDLSLVAWAMAKLCHGGEAFYGEVSAAVVARESAWGQTDPRNIATLIYSFAFAGNASEHDPAFRVLADAVQHRPEDFEMQGLTNALWGWATACYAERPWFASVASEVLVRAPSEFEPLDVANCLWAFASVPHTDLTVAARLKELAIPLLPEFTPQNTAISLWSLATLELRDEAFFERAGDHFVQHLTECKAQELNNTLWACATANIRLPWLFLKADAQAASCGLENFKTHELSIMMWAHGMAGVCNHEFFNLVIEEILDQRSIDSCTPREVSNMAWAYSTIIGCAHTPWLAAIAEYTPKRIAEFDLQCIGNVLWSFSTVGIFSETLFRAACEEMTCRCSGALPETVLNISQVVSAVHAARFTHIPFFEAAAERFLGVGSEHPVGTRELTALCNALRPSRELLIRIWPALEAALEVRVLAPLLNALPRRGLEVGSWACVDDHLQAWEAFDACVGDLELDHLGIFYTAIFLRESGVVCEVEVASPDAEAAGLSPVRSGGWAEVAAQECVRERARLVRDCADQPQKLSRQLDKVNKREIVAWARFDVLRTTRLRRLPGDHGGPPSTRPRPERRVERGRTFSWRQDLEGTSEFPAAARWIRPLVTKSRQAPNVVGEHDRSGHAERGALVDVASSWLLGDSVDDDHGCGASDVGVDVEVEGELQLYVTHFPCISCVCSIAQFARLFPGVKLHVSFADGRAAASRDLISLCLSQRERHIPDEISRSALSAST